MKRLTLFFAGVLLLSACASGPVVGGEFSEDPVAEDQSATTAATAESGSGQVVSIDDSGQSLTPADDPLERPEGSDDVEEELVVADDKPEPSPVEPTPTPPDPLEPVVTGEVPADLMDAILADAGSRSTTRAAISVIRAQAVTWSDGSLGCPVKGMSYTQALVDGYWVVLDAGGQQLDYRASMSGSFRYCAFGGLPPAGPGDL